MKIVDPARFLEERARFALAHTCERCTYHDRDKAACAHGYPDAKHREAQYTDEGARDGMFCKEFELE